jgi:hypothetical protein
LAARIFSIRFWENKRHHQHRRGSEQFDLFRLPCRGGAKRGNIHKGERLRHASMRRSSDRTSMRVAPPPIHGTLIATAAEDVPDRPLNYFVATNKPTKPRMLLIQNFPFFGPVGVLSSRCTNTSRPHSTFGGRTPDEVLCYQETEEKLAA